jgi:hypothetical protein
MKQKRAWFLSSRHFIKPLYFYCYLGLFIIDGLAAFGSEDMVEAITIDLVFLYFHDAFDYFSSFGEALGSFDHLINLMLNGPNNSNLGNSFRQK